MKKFGITPQQKIVDTAKSFGQTNIARQQGTTRIIYDTLELVPGVDIYRFFENVNTRQFPLTNLQNGNRLEMGEMMVLEYAFLNIMVVKFGTTGEPEEFELVDLSGSTLGHDLFNGTNVTGATWTLQKNYLRLATKIALGELSFMVGNTQTLKPISVAAFHPSYNKASKNESNTVFHFDSMLTVPPMLEFISPVKVIPLIAADLPSPDTAKLYLRLTYEGAASIVSPRQTF